MTDKLTLNLLVDGQSLTASKEIATFEGTRQYIECAFNYISDDWKDCNKRAFFKNKTTGVEKAQTLGDDCKCFIPHEVLDDPGYIMIATEGQKNDDDDTFIITTNTVGFYNNSTVHSGNETDPTPSEYMQVINAAEEAQQIAQSVRDDADNGKFNGKDGADGKDGATGADGAPGKDGADGKAATITVGSVTTGEPDTPASVVNSGTENAAVLDFLIPKGEKGESFIKVVTISDDTPVFLEESGLYYIHIDTSSSHNNTVSLIRDESILNVRLNQKYYPRASVDEGVLIWINNPEEYNKEYSQYLHNAFILGKDWNCLMGFEFGYEKGIWQWFDWCTQDDFLGNNDFYLFSQAYPQWKLLLEKFQSYSDDMADGVVTIGDKTSYLGKDVPTFTYTPKSELFPVDKALSTTSDNAVANSAVSKLLDDGHLTGIKLVYTTEELAALITEDNFKNPGDCLLFIVGTDGETIYIDFPSGTGMIDVPAQIYNGVYLLARPSTATTYSSNTLKYYDLAQLSALMPIAVPLFLGNKLSYLAQIIEIISYEEFVQNFTETEELLQNIYEPPFICRIDFDPTGKDLNSYVTLLNEGTVENGDLLIVFNTEDFGTAQKAYLLKGTSPYHPLDLSAYPIARNSLHPDVIATWESGWYQVTHEGYLGYSNSAAYAIYCPVGSMVYYDGDSWLNIIAEYSYIIDDMNDSSCWKYGYGVTQKDINDQIYSSLKTDTTLSADSSTQTFGLSASKELYIWLSNENNITGSEGTLSLNLFGTTVSIGTIAADTKNILIHLLRLSDGYAMIDWVYITNSSDVSTLSVEKGNSSMPLPISTNKAILTTSAGSFKSGTAVKVWEKL